MWVRGRTVLALLVLAVVAASSVTAVVVRGAGGKGADSSAGVSSSGRSGSDGAGWSASELAKMNKVLGLIESRYLTRVARGDLLDGALQGMLEALGDPYSTYMTKEEAAKFADSVQGAFTGIGADLAVENGSVVVQSPIKGSPAYRAGLQPRDIILMVNGESLQGLKLGEAIAKIRGPKGTKAKLKVLRPGVKQPIELELVRDRIDVETVRGELGDDGVGRLVISQFSLDTPGQFAAELRDMESKGLKGLVIDVRNNPGGALQAALLVAQQFVPAGKTMMLYEYRDGSRKPELSEGRTGVKGGSDAGASGEVKAAGKSADAPYPIVVLINKGSASASEVLAGALRQSAGAVLVGDTTYGKGVVQLSYDDEIGDGSLMKLTVSKWLLPDGKWIDKAGIRPDVEVSQPAYFLASKLPRGRELKADSAGDDVRNLQQILAGVGYPADREDGYFSVGTSEAVKAFQGDHGLQPTGVVDDKTAEKLEETLYRETLLNPAKDPQLQAAFAAVRSKL